MVDYLYRHYCLTEGCDVFIWYYSNKCPNNAEHQLDNDKTAIIEIKESQENG